VHEPPLSAGPKSQETHQAKLMNIATHTPVAALPAFLLPNPETVTAQLDPQLPEEVAELPSMFEEPETLPDTPGSLKMVIKSHGEHSHGQKIPA
jgi:hypothetical protein